MELREISVLVAFGAGILSFLSPCVLPLVPAYLGHMTGVAVSEGPGRPLSVVGHALAFVLGFSLVFVAIWASVGVVGYVVRDLVPYLRQAGGVVLIVLGLHMVGILRIPLLYQERRVALSPTSRRSLPRSALLGVLFAAGWTPCIGPILAGIIGLASLSETAAQGTYLLVAYAVGLGLPFLVAAWLWGHAARRLPTLGRYYTWISAVSGVMVIGVGMLMLTNTFTFISRYLQWATV